MQAAFRYTRQGPVGYLAGEGIGEDGAAVAQRCGQAAQVAVPGGGAEQFDRGFLEGAGDEEVVDPSHAEQASHDRAPGDDGADPQAGRGRFGQRGEVDDGAVAVVGDQRARYRTAVAQLAGEVVLDQEGSGGACHVDDLAASLGERTVPVGLWKVGWQ